MLYENASQATHGYREFAIELTRENGGLGQPGTYRAVTTDRDGREIAGTFYNPIDPWQVESALASIPSGSKALQRSVPGGSLDPVRDMGARLFDGLFDGRLGRAFRDERDTASEGVRLRLVTDDEQIAWLPWEFLYDRRRSDFLALSTRSPLVRTIGRTVPPAAPLERPVRILISVSDVTGQWKVAEELGVLEAAVGRTAAAECEILRAATIEQFTAAFREKDPHIVHLIATGVDHGDRAYRSSQQVLAFLNDAAEGTASPSHVLVEGKRLNDVFSAATDLRLVVLNGCRTDALAAAVARDVPAAVGHRGDVSDDAAVAFTDGLYTALLGGRSLDAAVTSGRLTIDSKYPGGREWSAPVFYLQTASPEFLTDPAQLDRPRTPAELGEIVAPAPTTVRAAAEARERQSLESQIAIHESNLKILSAQRAQFGDSAPSYLQDQIETANAEIERLRTHLADTEAHS